MRTRIASSLMAFALLTVSSAANAEHTLQEYRLFRALNVDLVGRIPTRAELAQFEDPAFNFDTWIDGHLTGPAYADRLRRIYMDLLRLEEGTSFTFNRNESQLRRLEVLDPAGRRRWVYFRLGQRRMREETDGWFCFTHTESGVRPSVTGVDMACNMPHNISAAAWNANTVEIKPWWLYRDYRSGMAATQRYNPDTWGAIAPGYQLASTQGTEPDGTPSTTIRICREETQTAAVGHYFYPAAPRTRTGLAGCDLPVRPLPADSAYARTNMGQPVSCSTQLGLTATMDCGCGVGLERCNPISSNATSGSTLLGAVSDPLGTGEPLAATNLTPGDMMRAAWSQEAQRFMEDIFENDRDFRQILTGRNTFVNGTLAQFYRSIQHNTCCGTGGTAGYDEPVPLFDPANVPAALLPHDINRWLPVADRGPRASGLLTMPIFLTKYGTRRARAHVLYNAFQCKDFVAGDVMLMAGTPNPNLMVRDGCRTCHATLEPMSAFFSRIQESNWTFLPATTFPATNPLCNAAMAATGFCREYYDPDFANASRGLLRGSYGSATNAEAGPAQLARNLVASPEFDQCVADNLAESFLGRTLDAEDAALRAQLRMAFAGEHKIRALVRAIIQSDAYRASNNLTATAARTGGI